MKTELEKLLHKIGDAIEAGDRIMGTDTKKNRRNQQSNPYYIYNRGNENKYQIDIIVYVYIIAKLFPSKVHELIRFEPKFSPRPTFDISKLKQLLDGVDMVKMLSGETENELDHRIIEILRMIARMVTEDVGESKSYDNINDEDTLLDVIYADVEDINKHYPVLTKKKSRAYRPKRLECREEKVKAVKALVASGISKLDVAKELGIGVATVYRMLDE